jgi:hypothetical protein
MFSKSLLQVAMRGVIQLFTENPNFAGEGLRFLAYILDQI